MQKIKIEDCCVDILNSIKKGNAVIVASHENGLNPNIMTISFGGVDHIWHKNLITFMVRKSRHTYDLITETGYLSLGIIKNENAAKFKHIFNIGGTTSGRDIDKVKKLGLTTIKSEVSPVPVISEFDITVECKLYYSMPMYEYSFPDKSTYYPNDDYHVVMLCGNTEYSKNNLHAPP